MIDTRRRPRTAQRVFGVLVSGWAVLGAASAGAETACTIIDDAGTYNTQRNQAIVLMQYQDLVVRATGGKIRCSEDSANARQICDVEGRGELLVEGGGAAAKVIRLNTDAKGQVHLYATGDVACGLASDF